MSNPYYVGACGGSKEWKQGMLHLFQKAVDAVEALPPEDQRSVLDLIHRRLVESRRLEIAENAALTLQAINEGNAKYGTLEDLKRDLKA